MTYVTQAKMIELFGEDEMLHLTNLYDADAVVVDATRVTAAIAWSASIIDSYAGVPYQLPLSTVPVVLEGYAADLARYQLDSIDPREDVRKRYEDAIAWLKLLALGKVDLGLPVADAIEPDAALIGGDTELSAPDDLRVFSCDALAGF